MILKDKHTGKIKKVLKIVVEKENGYGEVFTSIKELNEGYEDVPEKKYGGRVPKVGDYFYVISFDGKIQWSIWDGLEEDRNSFKGGNAFWTRDEAEKELARRKAYVILKEDTKGFVPDWKDSSKRKYSICYDYELRRLAMATSLCSKVSELAFATEEDAEASIEVHSSEWKTWLGVEDE